MGVFRTVNDHYNVNVSVDGLRSAVVFDKDGKVYNQQRGLNLTGKEKISVWNDAWSKARLPEITGTPRYRFKDSSIHFSMNRYFPLKNS